MTIVTNTKYAFAISVYDPHSTSYALCFAVFVTFDRITGSAHRKPVITTRSTTCPSYQRSEEQQFSQNIFQFIERVKT